MTSQQSSQSVEVSNEQLHSFSESTENPLQSLPTRAKEIYQKEYDCTLNNGNLKGLPYMGPDVQGKFAKYLANQPDGENEATFQRFCGFVYMNRWETKSGYVLGYEAYRDCIEELTNRVCETLSVLAGTEADRPTVAKRARKFMRGMLKRSFEGILAEWASIHAVADDLNLMNRETENSYADERREIDGRIGGIPVQVKPEGFERDFRGSHPLIEYRWGKEERSSERKLIVTYDPADFAEAEEEKVTADDMPAWMMVP